MAKEFGRLKNSANIGDLILVQGYFGSIFQVESWTHELEHTREAITEGILYDVTDVESGEALIAFHDEISLVCIAEKAEEYLRDQGVARADKGRGTATLSWGEYTAKEVMTMTKPKESERYNREIVDDLIDEWIDKKSLIELDGRDEGGEYAEKLAKIEERIRNITEGKR